MNIELGYEQIIALQIINDKPDTEGSKICKMADCSFEELYSLADYSFIDIGNERLKPFAVHPIITEAGKLALAESQTR